MRGYPLMEAGCILFTPSTEFVRVLMPCFETGVFGSCDVLGAQVVRLPRARRRALRRGRRPG